MLSLSIPRYKEFVETDTQEPLRLRRQVEAVLAENEMMSLALLARHIGIKPGVLARWLPEWSDCATASIECLMPLFASSGNPDMVFCRIKKSTDNDYVWERLMGCERRVPRDLPQCDDVPSASL